MNELPSGWDLTTLDGLLDSEGVFTDGDWVETKDQDPDGEVRLIQLADIGDGVFRNRSSRFLTAAKAKELGCTFLEPGDVLIARMPEPLGRACLFPGTGQPAVTAVDVCIVRPGLGGCNSQWLMHAVNAPQFRTRVSALESGTTRKRISRRNLATIEIPAPPLAEQQLLVETMEEQLSRLDAAEATLNQVLGRLGLYRQSTLNALADGAPLVRMGDVLSEPLANGRSVRTRAGGFPVLRLTAVRDGRIDVRATKPGDWTASDAAKYAVHEGDFLIARGNGSLSLVGRGGLVEREPMNPVAYPDTLIRARVRRSMCEPHFLRLVWDTSGVRQQIEKAARTTAGIHKINQMDLAGLLLPLPSVAEQQERTASAERRLSLLDSLHEQVELVRRRAGSLRRSLLASAFSGSLVQRETGR